MIGQCLCSVCNRHVHTHSYHLKCSICFLKTHLNCLPLVSKDDNLYVDRLRNNWFCMSCLKSALPFNHYDDDDEFVSAVSNDRSVGSKVLSMIDRRVVNAQNSEGDDVRGPLRDLDPDVNFFLNQSSVSYQSNYYTEASFVSMYASSNVSPNNLSLIHANIRSVQKNFVSFESYLKSLQTSFDIIGLSETWLNKETLNDFHAVGYTSQSLCRDCKSGGGVSILVRNSLNFRLRTDLSLINPNTEALFVEVPKLEADRTPSNVIIGVVYRPPNSSMPNFSVDISNILSKVKRDKAICYIMGDVNINLLNSDTHLQTAEFLETLYSFSFSPLITKPTRITDNTATLIDNIFTNFSPNKKGVAGILCTDITDHLPIFYIDQGVKVTERFEKVPLLQRQYSTKNKIRFHEELGNVNWTEVFESNDAQLSYTKFFNSFKTSYDSCFPLKPKKSTYKERCPWLTQGLRSSIKIKNKLYLKSIKYPTDTNKTAYKQYKIRLRTLLRQCERNYYDSCFKANKNNMRKTWKLIKDALNKTKRQSNAQNFNINNRTVDDKQLIANTFNNFFLNIGPNIAKNIPHSDLDFNHFLKERNLQTIFIRNTNEQEMTNIINGLKNTSAGWDEINISIIKSVSHLIIRPLVHCFNLSLETGVVPKELKIARVTPLFKGGESGEVGNYRPISVLPCFSKIIERIMHVRLSEFLQKHDILFRCQFGYRENYGTNLALTYITDKITTAFDDKKIALGTFIDLSKAFDTLNHNILLSKLSHYGIRGKANAWIRSYLYNRSQYVTYNGIDSYYGNVACGVPQGSILGPLLFLIYINDIVHVFDIVQPILYADDTNLFLTGTDINSMIECMNLELSKLSEWLNVNNLSLNVSKTHYVIFTPGRRKVIPGNDLYWKGHKLNREFCTTFLGVRMDEKLCWKNHIQYIKSKISKNIGIMWKARYIFNTSTLITLYYSFIYPYISYCIEVWGTAAKLYTDSILKLQKSCCRLITGSSKRASSAPLFKLLNIYPLLDVYNYNVMLLMFKFKKGLLPDIFNDLFTNCSESNIITRQHESFRMPLCKTQAAYNSIRMQGVKLWNMYKNKISLDSSYHCFKKSLRKLLLTVD